MECYKNLGMYRRALQYQRMVGYLWMRINQRYTNAWQDKQELFCVTDDIISLLLLSLLKESGVKRFLYILHGVVT